MITTNDKMNETVKETLKMRGDNMSLYALKRIEELEEQVKNCSTPAAEGQREQSNIKRWCLQCKCREAQRDGLCEQCFDEIG